MCTARVAVAGGFTLSAAGNRDVVPRDQPVCGAGACGPWRPGGYTAGASDCYKEPLTQEWPGAPPGEAPCLSPPALPTPRLELDVAFGAPGGWPHKTSGSNTRVGRRTQEGGLRGQF